MNTTPPRTATGTSKTTVTSVLAVTVVVMSGVT